MNNQKRYIKVELLIVFIVLAFLSCETRNWDNPFDTDCSKELFTPSDFTAEQENNVVVLNWVQNNIQISGFKIERKSDNGTFSVISTLPKNSTSVTDDNILGGEDYTYKLHAYAGSNKSNESLTSITPLFEPPTLTTNIFAYQNLTSAFGGGNITNAGNTPITARGICWSTSPNPTIINSKTSDGNGSGSFVSIITGLANNTKYYIRAYATNHGGTSYGNEIYFDFCMNVPGPSVTDVDGNVYKTVKIGTQFWMAENLKTTKYKNNDSIQYVTDGSVWMALSIGAFCYYLNKASNGENYGYLYNFFAAIDGRGICPNGWHLPSDSEWNELRNFLGGEDSAGGALKEIGTEYWDDPNIGATNISGFSAVGGSWRGTESGGFYYWLGYSSFFWSSTSYENDDVGKWLLYASNSNFIYNRGIYQHKNSGFSIRCIKD